MARTLITTLVAGSLAGAAAARTVTGSGHVIEQNRPIADFHTVRSSGGYVLDVTVGPTASVKLKGDDNLLAEIDTKVSNGQLLIKQGTDDDVHIEEGHVVHITVTVPRLDAFSGEGAGKVIFHDLKSDSFNLSYDGAGLVTASGSVRNLTVNASGAGSLDLKALKAINATAAINGVGTMNVYVSGDLTAAVNGIGSLNYFGHPTHVSRSLAGIGVINAGD